MIDKNGLEAAFQYIPVGEKADLGNALPLDQETLARHHKIDEMLQADGHVAGNTAMSIEETIEWLTPTATHQVYPVVGSSILMNKDEEGKLQGWIAVDSSQEEMERVKRSVEGAIPEDTLIMEFAAARYPESEGGQIPSARRQVCLEILKNNPNLIVPVKDGERTVAYQIKILITAYTALDNVKAANSLRQCGFIQQPEDVWWDDKEIGMTEKPKDHFWVLDWNWLLQNTAEQTDASVTTNPTKNQTGHKLVQPQFVGQLMYP